MQKLLFGTLAGVLLSAVTGCGPDALEAGETGEVTEALTASNASDRAALALRWAPVHYQDVDQTGSHALGGKADYITRYDYDGDLNGRNNWDNAGNARYPLAAHVYYSVTET